MQAVLGIALMLAVTWGLSEHRRKVRPKLIFAGLGLQVVLALVLLKIPGARGWISLANAVVGAIELATTQATSFLFGYLAGGPPPFQEVNPSASYLVAFRVLPMVLVLSALSAVLFHWGILPLIVKGFAYVLRRTLGLGGAAGLAAAADVFLGIAESPLFVRPYLSRMTRSELFLVMSCGMASVAGTVMVLYASAISAVVPDAVGHILVASVITIPIAVVLAHLLIPETAETTADEGRIETAARSTTDAIVQGTLEGLRMVASIVAIILVLFAFVNLINAGLGAIGNVGDGPLSLQRILSVVFRPIAWVIGIPWSETGSASGLLGSKLVMNEFVAYLELARLPAEALSEKSRIILTYALCGFANFASLGILMGTMTTLAPDRQREILSLGPWSLLTGSFATYITGALMGLLY